MLIPHLHFCGDCSEAISLYEKAFNAKAETIIRNSDYTPGVWITVLCYGLVPHEFSDSLTIHNYQKGLEPSWVESFCSCIAYDILNSDYL
jgi:hypothetical protein